MVKRLIAVVLITAGAVGLAGCASPNMYTAYSTAQKEIEVAKYTAQTAKYNAMSVIAATGDTTTRVAAVVAMAMGDTAGGGNGSGGSAQLTPPRDPADTAIQWASILVPATVQGLGIKYNRDVSVRQSDNNTLLGMRQSDNQAAVQINSNQTIQGVAGLIPETIKVLPKPVVVQSSTTNNYATPAPAATP